MSIPRHREYPLASVGVTHRPPIHQPPPGILMSGLTHALLKLPCRKGHHGSTDLTLRLFRHAPYEPQVAMLSRRVPRVQVGVTVCALACGGRRPARARGTPRTTTRARAALARARPTRPAVSSAGWERFPHGSPGFRTLVGLRPAWDTELSLRRLNLTRQRGRPVFCCRASVAVLV